MARYIDADKLIEHILKLKVVTDNMYGMGIARGIERAETAIEMQPTADVVPKSEIEKVLSDLKKQIHDKAIYPGAKDTYSFVNVKVFDAVLNNVLKKYTEGKDE